MTRLELLKNLSFGARVAEEETAIAKYFVETDQWDRIFRGDVDIVRGDKGAGKSAIYSLLATKAQNLLDRGILLVTAERPRGATVFRDLVAEPPTSENELIGLWKLYIVTLVAQKIKERGIDAKKLISALEDEGLLEPEFDLGRLFKQVRRYARSFKLEASASIDPNTGAPIVSGKITLGEPGTDLRSKGYTSVEMLADLANRALVSGGIPYLGVVRSLGCGILRIPRFGEKRPAGTVPCLS